MPRLSIFFVRTSLLYLLAGFSLGGVLLANKGIPFAPAAWSLLPAHFEVLLMGWMLQLALGVAFWILPRFAAGLPRGDERWSWAAFCLLNAGIAIVLLSGLPHQQAIALAGRVLEAAGLAAFVLGNWRRVKPLGA